MTLAPSSQPQRQQQDPGWLATIGARLFTWRTALPLPIALALLLIPSGYEPWRFLWPGVALVAAGESVRLWGVRQIGAVSRTRSERLGPLVSTGPFALVRNPLYLGNISLWGGFSLSAGLPGLAPIVVLLLGLVYHAIVRWEERLLESRLGEAYRVYMANVPRWIPRIVSTPQTSSGSTHRPGLPAAQFSWRDTLFSERGTLIAIAAGFALLSMKFAVLR